MSVRVNLLPREYEERARGRRMVALVLLGVLVWIGLLAFVQLAKFEAVDEARRERDDAAAEVAMLQSELAQLDAFADIAARVDATNALLIAAMGGEVSWARILNDVALTFPATSSLRSLTGQLTTAAAPTAPTDVFEPGADDIGFAEFEGYSIERFAPGVESVLLRFGDVRAFYQTFLQEAAEEDIEEVEVTSFLGQVRLDSSALTNRYAEGLPQEGLD